MDLGLPELLIILVVVLLLFGSSRLPMLSRNVGESLKELRKGISGATATAEEKNTKDKQKSTAGKSKA